jgi:hypothetical protein
MNIARLLHEVRERNFDRWLPAFARHAVERRLENGGPPRHLLFALCDHYEPLWGDANDTVGRARVAAWTEHYPRMASQYRDDDGFHPRHSFFFPGEQIGHHFLDELAGLVKRGFGEVEVHLHHDGDTSATLRESMTAYLHMLAEHGHLSRDGDKLKYAFIHGNWCLANARKDGRWCGVDDEMEILFETGCYADYTFPAAPDESQPGIINQIYWPTGDLGRRRAYESGERARVGDWRDDRLLIIEGPLALSFRKSRRPVRIENGALTGNDPGTMERVRSWVAQHVHVAGRPEWLFVKVHTHGAPEDNARSLLDGGGHEMHRALRHIAGERGMRLHYVTAREMFNIAKAAIDGKEGDPAEYRDYCLRPPPAAV